MFSYSAVTFQAAFFLISFSVTALHALCETSLEKQAYQAMKQATLFYRNEVSTQGGYLFKYTVDMKHRYGEMPARESQIWVQDPATPAVSQTYLNAHEATEDSIFLEAANAATRALIRGQLECGGWNYLIDFKAGSLESWYENEGHHPDFNEFSHFEGNATFDDRVTYGPIMLLLRLYHLTMDPEYLDPLNKALDFVLEAQYPCGAWSQRFPLISTGYDTYYTFNDSVINDNIKLMIHVYNVLAKRKYLESALRGADFIIASQHEGPQYGWGQQYTHDMKLAAGRLMEPAALCPSVTLNNIRSLMDIYEFTGNRCYLEPVPRALHWLDSVTSSDGTIARYLEEGTNRTMAAKYVGDSGSYTSIEITYDLSEAMEGYGFVLRNFSTKSERERYERLLSTSRDGPLEKPTTPSKSEALEKAVTMEKNIRSIIYALDERGRWTEDGRMHSERFYYKNAPEYVGPVMKNGWIRTRTFIKNMNTLSEYLRLLKIAGISN